MSRFHDAAFWAIEFIGATTSTTRCRIHVATWAVHA